MPQVLASGGGGGRAIRPGNPGLPRAGPGCGPLRVGEKRVRLLRRRIRIHHSDGNDRAPGSHRFPMDQEPLAQALLPGCGNVLPGWNSCSHSLHTYDARPAGHRPEWGWFTGAGQGPAHHLVQRTHRGAPVVGHGRTDRSSCVRAGHTLGLSPSRHGSDSPGVQWAASTTDGAAGLRLAGDGTRLEDTEGSAGNLGRLLLHAAGLGAHPDQPGLCP